MKIASDTIADWAEQIENCVKTELAATNAKDGSHDLGHLQRVTNLSLQFAKEESANELVAYTAGMLHDIVNLPKNHPDIKKGSLLAAARAEELLIGLDFPSELIPNVCHAIHAHSFSANIEPNTIEAKCVQDADRMEAMGAFGLMRVFYCCGQFRSELMHEEDPAGLNRELNDKKYALDHFVLKLLTLSGKMKTVSGRNKAKFLTAFLEDFRTQILKDHQENNKESGRFIIANCYRHAGETNIPLFHPTDPFAEIGRPLNPNEYALDSLLKSTDAYITTFIKQLRSELN